MGHEYVVCDMTDCYMPYVEGNFKMRVGNS
jgi:hypothetical protein